MPISGIYKIENLINGKIYIGQAVDIKARWRTHIFSANTLSHKDSSSPIHLALAKYGKENFSFTIVEECEINLLNEKEKFWIDYYDSYRKGYNASTGGDNGFTREDGRPVLLYDLKGNFQYEFCNIASAARFLNLGYATVYSVLQEKRKSCGGYMIKYKLEPNFPKQIEAYSGHRGDCKIVLQLDKNDNILAEYFSVNEAARQTNLDSSTISKVCRGKLKTHGGYKWKYKGDYQ